MDVVVNYPLPPFLLPSLPPSINMPHKNPLLVWRVRRSVDLSASVH